MWNIFSSVARLDGVNTFERHVDNHYRLKSNGLSIAHIMKEWNMKYVIVFVWTISQVPGMIPMCFGILLHANEA